jgi:metal-responsive CopG/Arc/MetJ family transcriptional regulator
VVFGKTNVKMDKDLVKRVEKYSRIAGYSSPAEFITHAIEKELLLLEDADSEEEIRKRLH